MSTILYIINNNLTVLQSEKNNFHCNLQLLKKLKKMNARLVYKSNNTCFRTILPVYFYGMPSGKMIVLYTREKENLQLNKSVEWVVAEHLDYKFDYKLDAIVDVQNREMEFKEFMEYTDKLEQHVKYLRTFGNFSTYTDAQQYLNANISQMLFNLRPVRAILNY